MRELSYQLQRREGTSQPGLLTATLVLDAEGTPLVVQAMVFGVTDPPLLVLVRC